MPLNRDLSKSNINFSEENKDFPEGNSNFLPIKESKGKKSKKTLSLTPSLRSGAESAPALPTDEEREEFYRIFFLKNFLKKQLICTIRKV